MILLIAVLLTATYITYIGITKPIKTAQLFRFFSLDAATQTDESRLSRALEIADKYYQTRDLMAAEKAYLRVLKIEHRNYIAYYRLGLVYSYLNNNSDALECFEIASQIRPTATVLHNFGMTLFKYRNYTKAAEVLEKANQKHASSSRHITLARIYRITNENDKQLEHLLKASELEKNNPDILLLLADCYLHMGRSEESTKVFKKLLRLDPNNQRARAALANR